MPLQSSDADALGGHIRFCASRSPRPYIVALDGRSGVGKSTLAAAVGNALGAAIIEGDDFFAGGTGMRSDPLCVRAADCIDWTRQRAVLDALRHGHDAIWRAFDWDAFDGRLQSSATVLTPRPVVILEGVYAARPELADLIDLKVIVTVSDALRERRLLPRAGGIGPWEHQWQEAETHYFRQVMPIERFDFLFEASLPAADLTIMS